MSVSHTPGEWTTKVRKRVRAALAEHEVSAAEVARRAGWKQQYLARRLTPSNPVPLSTVDIEAIASAIGVEPSDLMPARELAAVA